MTNGFSQMEIEEPHQEEKNSPNPGLSKEPIFLKKSLYNIETDVGLLSKQCSTLFRQNKELLRRQKINERALCKIVNNTNQSVEIYDALCTIFTNMSSLKDEVRQTMEQIKKPSPTYKPKQHVLSRANLTDGSPGTIPKVEESFLKLIEVAEKYKNMDKFHTPSQNVPVKKEQSAFDALKKYAFPTPFAEFTRKFLKIPSNCAFYKKGDRTYMCNSGNDRWERCESNYEFWNIVRDYLWQAYVRFICKVRDEHPTNKFLANVVREVQYIQPRNIPVNKAGLIYILQSKPSDGDTRLVELLEAAYRSRNKNH